MRIGRNEPGEVEEYTDFIKEAEGLKSTPVSYTHLDVYKRQGISQR